MSDFHTCVSAGFAELATVRHSLSAWLERAGVADPPRADVVLATHEATANAVEHSSSVTPVVISARVAGGMIVIQVNDKGHWKTPEANEERGRGLAMIAALVRR